ncbi:MAG: XTP/dITP diphosphohydrolase [Phormidesmis priestleyi Ana]|uniref:XTP/dITP diphosphohydrolase n=1 Tax=Phormidesmis priestleyi Ana TaxID=1666911 RepID=A0A0P8DJ94_9CYAN|nr:MAG: XTP/dITP diphosphohydrolase [Phormidesmis priestleyi Ana]
MNISPDLSPNPSPPSQPNADLGEPLTATPSATLAELQRLIAVIAQLRNPDGGCPWDLAQTPLTLTPYVIEEAYEVVDAIQSGNKQDIAEELGDLLLQVVLQSQVFQDQGDFDLSDVAKGIADKMVRRHPHVFETTEGNPNPTTPAAVKQTWEEIKTAEKAHIEDPTRLSPKLKRYARSMPPLLGALKISKKAAKAGFEWNNIEEVWEKVAEEMAEFRHALDHESKADQEGELGDLFFSLIQIARWKGLDPVAALQGTNRRFVQRFEKVEAQAEKPMTEYSVEELNAFWNQAKQQISKQQTSQVSLE